MWIVSGSGSALAPQNGIRNVHSLYSHKPTEFESTVGCPSHWLSGTDALCQGEGSQTHARQSQYPPKNNRNFLARNDVLR